MKTSLVSFAAALLALSLVAVARAQSVSGSAQGAFRNPLPPGASNVFNPAEGTFSNIATFMTGQNLPGAIGYTGAMFTGVAGGFNNVNVALAPTVQLGTIRWSNSLTVAGTAANSVTFDLRVTFTTPGAQEFTYTPFNLIFDGGGNPANDDLFTITAPTGGLINFAGTAYKYAFSFDQASFVLAEPSLTAGATLGSSNVFVTFAAVPEPSTYAIAGVGALALMIGVRRLRSRTRN